MTFLPSLRTLLAFVAGAATVFGFAPFGIALVPIVMLALLMLLWQGAETPRLASLLGFAFGFGLFGTGVSWVYIALNTFGGMPLPVAAVFTACFCAYLRSFRPRPAGSTRAGRLRLVEGAIAATAAWIGS
jgi:apolipoprotein N-acyltransferase